MTNYQKLRSLLELKRLADEAGYELIKKQTQT